MTTFGEITSVAEAHFADAQSILRRRDGAAELADPGTTAAFARLTGVLARYTDQAATGFGSRPGPKRDMESAAEHSAQLLRRAQAAAISPEAIEPGTSPLALRLRDTAQALGCGLDLLVSHFARRSNAGRSPTSAALTTPDTTRHLLHLVGRYAAGLARMAEQSDTSGLRQAGTLLFEVDRHLPKAGRGAVPLAAVALRTRPRRQPPTTGEDLSRTAQGIAASAQRLIECEHGESISTWRSVAASADISHRLTDQILRHLGKRLIELNHHKAASSVAEAAHHLRGAAGHWHRISVGLRELTTADRHASSEPSTDANDLTLRLGRLLYTDPSWTPGLRGGTTIRAPGDLTPNPATACTLTLAVMRAMDALRIAADRHPTGIEASIQTGTLWAPLPAPRHQPEIYGNAKTRETQPVLRHYHRAHAHDRQATLALGRAVLALARGHTRPVLANQAALIMRRAEAHTASGPAALAGTDFPIPINAAISTPAPPASARSPAPTTLQTIGRTT